MEMFIAPRLIERNVKGLKDKSDKMLRVIQTDDVLEIAAHNRFTKPLKSLKQNYIGIMLNEYCASIEIINYRTKTKKPCYITVKDYKALDQSKKSDYEPVIKYYFNLNDHTIIESCSKFFSILLYKLSYANNSRFREIIQTCIDSELFEFKHRKASTKRLIKDATRFMVGRRFYIRRYEWGLIFDHDISSVIHAALNKIIAKNISGIRCKKNTVYLYESNSYKIKIYNISVADDKTRRSEEPEFKSGDRLKFEITYKTAYLRRRGLKIHHLKTQDVIADLFSSKNNQLFETYFLSKLNPQELRNLFIAAKVSSRFEFSDLIKNAMVETFAEQKHGEIYSESKQAMKSLVQQNNAQLKPLDEEKIQDMKERYKIPMYQKDQRKVRVTE